MKSLQLRCCANRCSVKKKEKKSAFYSKRDVIQQLETLDVLLRVIVTGNKKCGRTDARSVISRKDTQ